MVLIQSSLTESQFKTIVSRSKVGKRIQTVSGFVYQAKALGHFNEIVLVQNANLPSQVADARNSLPTHHTLMLGWKLCCILVLLFYDKNICDKCE